MSCPTCPRAEMGTLIMCSGGRAGQRQVGIGRGIGGGGHAPEHGKACGVVEQRRREPPAPAQGKRSSAAPAPASPAPHGAACSSGCTPARPVHAYWIQYEEPLSSVPSLDVVRDCDLPQRLSPRCQSRVVIRLIATDAGRGLLTRPRSAED